MLLAALAFLGAALAALIVWGYNPVGRWQMRKFPGPRPNWLLGNLRQLGRMGSSHLQMQRWAQQYGPAFRFFLGRYPVVVLSDPALVRQVAVKRFMQYHDRMKPVLEIGTEEDTRFQRIGILFAEGKFWLGVRTACEPLFHSTALASYAPMMSAAADQLMDKLQAAAGSGDATNVSELLKEMSLDVIGSTVFGVDFEAQKEGSNSLLVEAAETMFSPMAGMPLWGVFMSFAAPKLRRLWYQIAVRSGGNALRKSVAARRFLWGASQALLDNARRQGAGGEAQPSRTNGSAAGGAAAGEQPGEKQQQEGQAGGAGGDQEFAKEALHETSLEEALKPVRASASFRAAYQAFASRTPPASSIVSRLKNAVNKQTGLQLSDTDINAQLFTFLLAGYETTSLALSYTLFLLAKHPEAQQRAFQEVAAFGRDRPIGYEDLPQFQYTEAAFLESMRLYPPVSPIVALLREPRGGGAELRIARPSGGSKSGPGAGSTAEGEEEEEEAVYHIPAGTRVQLNVWTIHRDPALWPDPEEYRPERFLPGSKDAAASDPGAFFPFGLGPRKCVGYRFALEEAVLTLARLLQRFELRLDGERHKGPLELISSVTLVPVGGIWLRVHSRAK